MACPAHVAKQAPPLFVNGTVQFQAHHVGWIVSGAFTIVSAVASFWLIQKHVKWYYCKPQQRHIVRLLFMVPIYSIITLASYVFYTHATSLLLIRDAYESVVLASFFALLLEHLPGPIPPPPPAHRRLSSKSNSHRRSRSESHQGDIEETLPITGLGNEDAGAEKPVKLASGINNMSKAERRAVIHRTFHALEMHANPASTLPSSRPPLKWIWPLGRVRARPKDGLSFLQYMKWGILQYCIVRPGSALAAVILQHFDLYCETSWSPKWGHVWIVTAVSISVTVAMYCLLQLYFMIKEELKPYRPLLKLFAVKAVVFLTFWQSALLSGLASLDIIKDTEYMTAEDITIGFGALLQTLEMMCFAFLHVKAFSYQPYKRLALASPTAPTLLSPPFTAHRQFSNIAHAFDFLDTFRDIHTSVLYHFGKGPSREADDACRRGAGFREVFGRERLLPGGVGGTAMTEEENEEQTSTPRSFVRTYGYRGISPEEGTDERYTSMRDVTRNIRKPSVVNVRYQPLPTPQTSPREEGQAESDLGIGMAMRLDDQPPMPVWNMASESGPIQGRTSRGIRPLPAGAYIPRLPGSPPPWMSTSTNIVAQRSGPVVMVTPPPTPPHSPLRPTVPSSSNTARNHISPPRSHTHPLAPHVRLSALPNSQHQARLPQTPNSHLSPASNAHLSLSSNEPPRSPSPAHSGEDSLLARIFSGPRTGETEHTGFTGMTGYARNSMIADDASLASSARSRSSYKTADAGSSRRERSASETTQGSTSLSGMSGRRSSGTASYRTWERGVVRTGQVVVLGSGEEEYFEQPRASYRSSMPPIPSESVPSGELDMGDIPASTGVLPMHHTSNYDNVRANPPSQQIPLSLNVSPLPSPPGPTRLLRHVGPNIQSRARELGARSRPQGPSIQPRTIVLPTPLSPARYPYPTWRVPETISPEQSRPVPWSLLQTRPNSSESGLAGWASGRGATRSNESPVFAVHANGSSSLSSLSNIEDRYPSVAVRGSRDLGRG